MASHPTTDKRLSNPTTPATHAPRSKSFKADVMPFLTSLGLHLGIVAIGILTIKFVPPLVSGPTTKEVPWIPQSPDSGGGPFKDNTNTDIFGKADDGKNKVQQIDFSGIKESANMDTKPGPVLEKALGLAGDPNSSGTETEIGPGFGRSPFGFHGTPGQVGGPGGDGNGVATTGFPPHPGSNTGRPGGSDSLLGDGPKTEGAQHVIYVCDASGSMNGLFDSLRGHMTAAIGAMRPFDTFNIIFFQSGDAAALNKDRMECATPEVKLRVSEFLTNTVARSSTDPLPALELAFKQHPSRIVLLTDGDFPDNTAVLNFVRAHKGSVQIDTIAFTGDGDTEYLKVLKQIADESGGKAKQYDKGSLSK